MQMRVGKYIALGILVSLLAACASKKDPKLLNFPKSTKGPDEFAILPSKPLQAPVSYAELPPPTLGGSNITDPTPEADAVAALGGKPSLLTSAGVRATDQGLVNYAGRYGVAGNIRQQLASEDLEFRKRNNGRLLERLANVNLYFESYSAYSLDQHRELAKWRRAGARTPSAPPRLPKE